MCIVQNKHKNNKKGIQKNKKKNEKNNTGSANMKFKLMLKLTKYKKN